MAIGIKIWLISFSAIRQFYLDSQQHTVWSVWFVALHKIPHQSCSHTSGRRNLERESIYYSIHRQDRHVYKQCLTGVTMNCIVYSLFQVLTWLWYSFFFTVPGLPPYVHINSFTTISRGNGAYSGLMIFWRVFLI